MASRLLDRQFGLLTYLTSAAAIFGEDSAFPIDAALSGFDLQLLRLEARFSHEKRLEKIAGVFSRTLALLGPEQTQVLREFAHRYPSSSIGRIENGREFYGFLSELWRLRPPRLSYLADLAACELAFAEIRSPEVPCETSAHWDGHPGGIRRHPGTALVRCDYDVRPLFEADDINIAIVRRPTLVAVASPRGAVETQVWELDRAIFELLSALNDWSERAAFGDTPEADALIGELLSHGLLEASG
jgi:hypothetical protein